MAATFGWSGASARLSSRRRWAALVSAAIAFTAIASPGAFAATANPIPWDGANPTCDVLQGNDLVGFGVSPGNGTYSDGTLEVDISNFVQAAGDENPGTFNWSSNLGVDAVIVHAGEASHHIYAYSPEATSDSGLTAQAEQGNTITKITFCYDGAPREDPTNEPTEQPTPTGTTEPTATAEPTGTTEPTPTTEPSATVEPTATIEPTPTTEPTPTPTTEPTPTPTGTAVPTDEPNEPTLILFVQEPFCDGDAPYLGYEVAATGTETETVTITFVNPDGDDVVYTDMPFVGQVPWPGAVFDEDGNVVDWPGWRFEDDQWVVGDEFDWVRPSVEVVFQVDAMEITVDVDYPPSAPDCNPNPPEGEVLAATGTPPSSLPPTDAFGNAGDAGSGGLLRALVFLGAIVLTIGFLTPMPARARRRSRR